VTGLRSKVLQMKPISDLSLLKVCSGLLSPDIQIPRYLWAVFGLEMRIWLLQKDKGLEMLAYALWAFFPSSRRVSVFRC
jgi:hypothetical protein